MEETLQQALAAARLHTDQRLYSVAHLPAGALNAALQCFVPAEDEFGGILVDKDEITLILTREQLAQQQARLPDFRLSEGFRLITFDLPLEHDLVGFMAAVSGALAAAAIPLMAYSAFERDHLLIHADHYDHALQVIHALQEQARSAR